jgi:hypothetical protein
MQERKVVYYPVGVKNRNHNLTHEIYNAVLPENAAYTPMVIESQMR